MKKSRRGTSLVTNEFQLVAREVIRLRVNFDKTATPSATRRNVIFVKCRLPCVRFAEFQGYVDQRARCLRDNRNYVRASLRRYVALPVETLSGDLADFFFFFLGQKVRRGVRGDVAEKYELYARGQIKLGRSGCSWSTAGIISVITSIIGVAIHRRERSARERTSQTARWNLANILRNARGENFCWITYRIFLLRDPRIYPYKNRMKRVSQ